MSAVLNPAPDVVIKLGLIAIHAEELLTPAAHLLDHTALSTLLRDRDLGLWLSEMEQRKLIPARRP